jgi:cell division protein FtsL
VLEEEINIEQLPTQTKLQKMVETILRAFGIDDFISYAQVMHNFLFVVAIVLIGVVEIFNTHMAVRLNRGINKKQETIKELRWEYMTVKTEMNQKSKQSELQKILEPYGLKSLVQPPQKIEVKKGTLE